MYINDKQLGKKLMFLGNMLINHFISTKSMKYDAEAGERDDKCLLLPHKNF
jgi:hypothetical protein